MSCCPSATMAGTALKIMQRCSPPASLVSSNSKFSLTLTGGSGFVVRSTETDNTLFQKGEWDGSCLCMLNSAINIDSIQEVLLTVGTEAFTLAAD